LFIVTVMVWLMPWLFALSRARAAMVWVWGPLQG
jgi:hypothetical protein